MLNTNLREDTGPHLRVGLTAPINMTALRAVLDTVQSIWPEGELGTPADGEAAVILIPRKALLSEEHKPLHPEASTARSRHQVEPRDVTAQTDVAVMAPDGAEVTPPEEVLNLLSGYCHGLLESLPEGVEAVRQTIRLPGREEPYVLSLQPQKRTNSDRWAQWSEGVGWVEGEVEPETPSEGDQMRRKALQRIASIPAVNRTLNRNTRAQIMEALKAD